MPDMDGLGFIGLGLEPTAHKFYGGSVTVFYDDILHQYTRFNRDNKLKIIPGVTSAVHIIDKSAALTQWAANMATQYVDQKLTEEETNVSAAMGGLTEGELSQFMIQSTTVRGWLNDARFNFQKYKQAASDTGKIAHDWVEQYIRTLINGDSGREEELLSNMPEDERARNGANAALRWMAAHQVKWVCTERKIYSLKYDYAGTLDGLAYFSSCGNAECCGYTDLSTGQRVAVEFHNVLAIIDWKTSNRLYEEYEYQAVAYLKAQEEEHGFRIPLRAIVRLGKDDGEFEARLLFEDTIERDFQIYLECLALYRSVEGRKNDERVVRDTVKALLRAAREAAKEAEKVAKKAAKELLKLQKETMFIEFRGQGLSIKAAKAAVSAAFAQVADEEEEIAA